MPPQTLEFQNPRPGKPLYWFPKAAAQVPQTGWDRIAEIYCLIVLELELHFQGHAPSETLGENHSLLFLSSWCCVCAYAHMHVYAQ